MATRPFDWDELVLGYDDKSQYLIFGYLSNLHKSIDSSIELFTNIPNLIIHTMLSYCYIKEYWNVLEKEFELSQMHRSIAIIDKLNCIGKSAYGTVVFNSTQKFIVNGIYK